MHLLRHKAHRDRLLQPKTGPKIGKAPTDVCARCRLRASRGNAGEVVGQSR
jgi:hypothetical protein